MGLWAGCATPEGTPAATLPAGPTPTRVPTRVPTPTATPLPPVTVELSGKIDDAGMLLEDVEVISGDGVAVLYLAKGTRVVDASGKPLDSITVTAGPPEVPWYEHYLYGLAYDFSPGGARFDPSARLTISYDPTLLDQDIVKDKPQIGYFEEAELAWIWLEVTADLDIHCVTAGIDHLGTFIVSFEVLYFPVS